ncbi:ABC transporter ATP-binding protein [Amycolatopsis alkalitolerans]|uniref:ABC transporter ATP-binding protein n=1 Tax=Amycolatopsis alkalitolerans TaxID=2547244 RepID=A0A5C4LWX8_9PSEU|nr:ABC transporter ATP-binding protein [Amycolatopsis alkalitolerans]TNC22363.1 ABC transporter ATP-binding protein [Amycolatopsis alkalitolerans]
MTASTQVSATEPAPDRAGPLLTLDGVRVTLRGSGVDLVRDATLDVGAGETVCLVGESGSGKSVTARTILGLTRRDPAFAVQGRITLAGRNLAEAGDGELRRLRGREMAMVFQEPLSALDPVFTVAAQLSEALRREGRSSRRAERARMRELLGEVGISDAGRVLRSYPYQLSGGMCQRVMIAMALACSPKLLIADEPTTALDVTVQAQILDLIDRLRSDTGMSVLLVTHDLGVAAEVADRVAVMYAGRVVEVGEPAQIFGGPRHPYTAGLLACIPPLEGERPGRLPDIPGGVPEPGRLPAGCAFQPRCARALDRCGTEDPPLVTAGPVPTACWNPQDGDRS